MLEVYKKTNHVYKCNLFKSVFFSLLTFCNGHVNLKLTIHF